MRKTPREMVNLMARINDTLPRGTSKTWADEMYQFLRAVGEEMDREDVETGDETRNWPKPKWRLW
jgi:hypothetical protein